MKRLIFKKIYILNDIFKEAKIVEFKKGLNIILGINKSGKSSIIKSLFYCFGAELKFENDWLTSTAKRIAVVFEYDNKEYIVERKKKDFFLFFNDLNKTPILIKEKHEVFNRKLMEIFNIEFEWITKNQKNYPMTASHLFNFSYIDQDKGWQEIGKNFENLGFIKDYKALSLDFFTGYLAEDYFKLKRNEEMMALNLNVEKNNFKQIKDFLESLSSFREKDFSFDFKFIPELKKLEYLERKLNQIERKISVFEKDLYEVEIGINYFKQLISEVKSDHSFSQKLHSELTCILCGSIHLNTILEKAELLKDIERMNKHISIEKEKRLTLKEKLLSLYKYKKELKRKIAGLNISLKKYNKNLDIYKEIKNKGKLEFYTKAESKIKNKEIEIKNIESRLNVLKSDLSSLKSRKRVESLKKDIIDYFKPICESIDSELNTKFKKFLPVLDKTGSSTPIIIYSYYSALYLYNLEKNNEAFDFLVIDTPNQQGQDKENLNKIFSTLTNFTSKEGQVIIGTEISTGFEEEIGTNLIELKEKRKCMSTEDYFECESFFSVLNY